MVKSSNTLFRQTLTKNILLWLLLCVVVLLFNSVFWWRTSHVGLFFYGIYLWSKHRQGWLWHAIFGSQNFRLICWFTHRSLLFPQQMVLAALHNSMCFHKIRIATSYSNYIMIMIHAHLIYFRILNNRLYKRIWVNFLVILNSCHSFSHHCYLPKFEILPNIWGIFSMFFSIVDHWIPIFQSFSLTPRK